MRGRGGDEGEGRGRAIPALRSCLASTAPDSVLPAPQPRKSSPPVSPTPALPLHLQVLRTHLPRGNFLNPCSPWGAGQVCRCSLSD